MLCLLSVLPVALAPAAGATARPRAAVQADGTAVQIVLNAMSPRSPDPHLPAQPVTFDVTVTNTTDNTYSDAELGIRRGAVDRPAAAAGLGDQAATADHRADGDGSAATGPARCCRGRA